MRVLVAYLSQTGNTRKVAEAIYDAIEAEKEIKPLGEVESLEGYDLAFIGFPIHASNPATDAKAFLEEKGKGKRIAVFVTHAAPEDHENVARYLENCKASLAEVDLLGMFDCQGEMAQAVIDFLAKSDNPRHQQFAQYGPQTKGQPDESRLEKARAFAREVMEKAC
ncbi:MAG: flavodoxin [Actinobacteria bacterium]|nr:flavodoxin [Actinomycetota bacterium]